MAALLGWNIHIALSNNCSVTRAASNRDLPAVDIACWWGTVFRPLSERLVEIDCGTVCMGIRAGNVGYSPDECCVVSSTKCGKG